MAHADRLPFSRQLETTVTHRLVAKLRAGGFECTQDGPAVTSINVFDPDDRRTLPRKLRNLMILPQVKDRELAPIKNGLFVYMTSRQVIPRLWTFGKRFVRLAEWSLAVEKLKKHAACLREAAAKIGVDVLTTSIETAYFTSNGEVLYHVHCHMIVDHPQIDYDIYNRFFARWRRKLGYFRADGIYGADAIKNVIRYAFKAKDEIDSLENPKSHVQKVDLVDLPQSALVAFAQISIGVRLIGTHGGFKIWMRQFEPTRSPVFRMSDHVFAGLEVEIHIDEYPTNAKQLKRLRRSAFDLACESLTHLTDNDVRRAQARKLVQSGRLLWRGRTKLELVLAKDKRTSLVKAVPCDRPRGGSQKNESPTKVSDIIIGVKSARVLIAGCSDLSLDQIASLPRNVRWLRTINDYRAILNGWMIPANRLPIVGPSLAFKNYRYRLERNALGDDCLVSIDAEAMLTTIYNQGYILDTSKWHFRLPGKCFQIPGPRVIAPP